MKSCDCSWYGSPAPPGHARVTERCTHRAACLSCCWVARWRRRSCSSHCPRLVWSEPRFAWSPWSLPGPLWKPETENNITHLTEKKRIYYNFAASQIAFILDMNTSCVGNTMKTQTSRNITPLYRVDHSPLLFSSCSEANNTKPEQQEEHIYEALQAYTSDFWGDFNDTSGNIWFSTFR